MATRRDIIERITRGQSTNAYWFSERSRCLTASTIRDLLTKSGKVPQRIVQRLDGAIDPLEGKAVSAACTFGLQSELPAMELYAKQSFGSVGRYYQPGLCIHEKLTWLGATPDFIVYHRNSTQACPGLPDPHAPPSDAWLVEVKSFMENPKATTIQDLARIRGTKFCCDVTADGSLELRRNHHFYLQIMGQLAVVFGNRVTNEHFCDLLLYYRSNITVIRVKFCVDSWQRNILPALERSYEYCLYSNQ